ncbi:LGFP repeat-containing protein [Kineococcus gynurae]|uniref:LGFP repeat-containing protein n=1 Tax=Kineococcus gynurae TaxID=452979 RepID=A0ABV5LXC5_9ACTN
MTALLERLSTALAARTSRRGFLARSAVVGSAVAVSPLGYVLKPQSAYAAVCGIDSTCSSGYTVFCATVNNGVNRCPPGSLVGGWWKSDGSGYCCGGPRYYIDCHSYCSCGCDGRSRFCGEGCRNCSCGCGPAGQCDQRKVCCNEFRYGQCNQDVRCTGPVWCRVVTCTPPYQIPTWGCTSTSATDQRTNNHSAPGLTDCTAIARKHTELGGPGGPLGEQRTPEWPTADRAGVYQHFDGGSIYFSGTTGAHAVQGAIRDRWAQLGWENAFGFPTTDEWRTPDGVGRFTHFQWGSIYWTPDTGANAVQGLIRDAWAQLGWETGVLGYPLISETRTPNGRGAYNHFQRGSIYWSPATSAHHVRGAIRDRWAGSGWEAGPLGFPTTDEAPVAGGAFSVFENGSIYWSPATGARIVTEPIRLAWLNAGGPEGNLGFPSGEARPDGNDRVRQDFQRGSARLTVSTGRVDLLR